MRPAIAHLVKPEEADLKDAVGLAYGALFGYDSELAGPDEDEASDYVSDESKQQ